MRKHKLIEVTVLAAVLGAIAVATLPFVPYEERANGAEAQTAVCSGAGWKVIGGPCPSRSREGAASFNCRDNSLCLYNCVNALDTSQCHRLQLGNLFEGDGWVNLKQFGWSNEVKAVKNTRNRISKLAAGPGGAGTQYCALANSQDGSLRNNAIGYDNASSFRHWTHFASC